MKRLESIDGSGGSPTRAADRFIEEHGGELEALARFVPGQLLEAFKRDARSDRFLPKKCLADRLRAARLLGDPHVLQARQAVTLLSTTSSSPDLVAAILDAFTPRRRPLSSPRPRDACKTSATARSNFFSWLWGTQPFSGFEGDGVDDKQEAVSRLCDRAKAGLAGGRQKPANLTSMVQDARGRDVSYHKALLWVLAWHMVGVKSAVEIARLADVQREELPGVITRGATKVITHVVEGLNFPVRFRPGKGTWYLAHLDATSEREGTPDSRPRKAGTAPSPPRVVDQARNRPRDGVVSRQAMRRRDRRRENGRAGES